MFNWITEFVQRTGYLGIALLMFAENVFPPIPSELIMPLAGFSAAQGKLSLVGVALAGIAGSLLGAFLWYAVGLWFGCERLKRFAARYGRWLTLSPGEVDRAQAWFHRHGSKAVLIGRLVPAVRSLISIPAGVTEMPIAPFLVYTTIGTALWSALLIGAGYLLENQYTKVADYLEPVSYVIVALIVAAYLWRVATWSAGSAQK